MRAEQDSHDLLLRRNNLFEGGIAENEQAYSQSKSGGLDLSSFLKLIRRNILLITGTAVVVASAAACTSLNSLPTYQGKARILVEPITSQGRAADPSAISREGSVDVNSVDYATLLQVLRSPELLAKIAASIQSRYPDVTANSLSQDLQAESLIVERLGTNLLDSAKVIEIKYEGQNPQKVQFVLEELTKGYLKYSLEDRKTRIGAGVQFIEDQLPSLQQRVNTLEADLQELKQRYRINDPANEATDLSKQAQDIQAQKLQTQRDLAEQQTVYIKLQNQLGLTPEEALAAASLSENSSYQSVVTELKKVESQVAIKSARFSQESPVLQGLLEQRRTLTQLLNQEAQRTLGQSFSASGNPQILAYQNPLRLELIKQLITAANVSQQLQVRAQAIAQAEVFINQRLQQLPSISRRYTDLQQRLEIATKTLNQFLTQRETLRIEAVQKEVPWEIIAAPSLEKDDQGNLVPSASPIPKLLIMGLLGGLLLGFVVALIKEKRKNVFYSGDDIQQATGLPFLSAIPSRGSITATVPTGANSVLFEKAFNSLYTNLRFLYANPAVSSIVVSSATARDGKTTVALHLALEAASMGQRVLLVDANLRNPQLHTALGLPISPGLGDVLLDQVKLDEVIQPASSNANLAVLTAGQPSQDLAKLLALTELQTLMQQMQHNFDLVIYDTPSLADYPDANFLTANATGLLMVVGVGATKRSSLTQVLAELNRFHLPVLGFVSNQPKVGSAEPPNQDTFAVQGYGNQDNSLTRLRVPNISTSLK